MEVGRIGGIDQGYSGENLNGSKFNVLNGLLLFKGSIP
jgi:hypothetical protein